MGISEMKMQLTKNNSIPFILCFLMKEGDKSYWSLKHKDQFVVLEISCIVSSVLKWLKTVAKD